jgi:hypothetical protein
MYLGGKEPCPIASLSKIGHGLTWDLPRVQNLLEGACDGKSGQKDVGFRMSRV